MDELHPVARIAEAVAFGRQRLPQLGIGGVVVEDLDDQPLTRVVDPDQRPERLDHEVRRLLVGRHLEAHDRPHRGRWRDRLDHQRPAQRIDHLEHGRRHQRQRRELDREQHETQQQPDRRVGERHGDADQVRRVHDRADHQAAEGRRARRPPLAWRRNGHHQGCRRDQRSRRGRLQLSCQPCGDDTGHHHERHPPHARGDPRPAGGEQDGRGEGHEQRRRGEALDHRAAAPKRPWPAAAGRSRGFVFKALLPGGSLGRRVRAPEGAAHRSATGSPSTLAGARLRAPKPRRAGRVGNLAAPAPGWRGGPAWLQPACKAARGAGGGA